jgi:hypothetical protein
MAIFKSVTFDSVTTDAIVSGTVAVTNVSEQRLVVLQGTPSRRFHGIGHLCNLGLTIISDFDRLSGGIIIGVHGDHRRQ